VRIGVSRQYYFLGGRWGKPSWRMTFADCRRQFLSWQGITLAALEHAGGAGVLGSYLPSERCIDDKAADRRNVGRTHFAWRGEEWGSGWGAC